MVVARPLCVITAFVLCHMTMGKLAEQCCKSQESIFGMMLKGFIFKKIRVTSPIECLQACNADFRCHSFNYVFAQDICELNNRTKEARPANFVKDFYRYYFERNTKAVQLGSIPELPAISCKEIKASDGERGVSGNYWFDSVIPGKTILLYCDMDIVDADECKNSSIPVCHSNAACHNTIGSFVCSCVLGFYGNGKTCQDIDECVSSPCDKNAACQNTLGSYVCTCNPGYAGDGKRCGIPIKSCSAYRDRPETADGSYMLGIGQSLFPVYCDMTDGGKGWTLVARFSNNDEKRWMLYGGLWWYDTITPHGNASDPSDNKDMISEAFWLVKGTEFKITRSDDPQHTPLLQTTGNCLGGQTFRSKMTNYGNFRVSVWSNNSCRGRCAVQYGGQYKSTQGFGQATCSSNLQSANNIGFWCDWGIGDGSVMMIGGGGSSCLRADHGIGITEQDAASFATTSFKYDFGHDAYYSYPSTRSYSLNLWIDADECVASSSLCHINATCGNTDNSHTCSCKPGFLGDGLNCTDIDECASSPCNENAACQNTPGSFVCACNPGYVGHGKKCRDDNRTCAAYRDRSETNDGTFILGLGQSLFSAYCDMTSNGQGWTLVARFSNGDAKNWMQGNGFWWYDTTATRGKTLDPSHNMDMISKAFWRVNGTEFKITRSDDPQHTPLLQTTGNCLGGQTFRSKMTSFGNFRSSVWSSNSCRGRCTVQYGGQYQSTQGFGQAMCSSNLQSANNIGFWCDWNGGDGSVMMIGGGGDSCSRADHGIGITEQDSAQFGPESYSKEFDFGYNAENTPTSSYSLNLWIR